MSRTPRLSTLASLFMLCAGPMAFAADVEPGSRVRVRADGLRASGLVGRVIALDEDSLTVQPVGDAAIVVPWSLMTRLEVSTPKEPGGAWRRGALRGALLGALLGVARGGGERHVVQPKALLAVVGGTAGSALGAAIGATAAGETWAPVRLPPAGGAPPGSAAPTIREPDDTVARGEPARRAH